jgi:hypothetical protein
MNTFKLYDEFAKIMDTLKKYMISLIKLWTYSNYMISLPKLLTIWSKFIKWYFEWTSCLNSSPFVILYDFSYVKHAFIQIPFICDLYNCVYVCVVTVKMPCEVLWCHNIPLILALLHSIVANTFVVPYSLVGMFLLHRRHQG